MLVSHALRSSHVAPFQNRGVPTTFSGSPQTFFHAPIFLSPVPSSPLCVSKAMSNALAYVSLVKETLKDSPDMIASFYGVMKDLNEKRCGCVRVADCLFSQPSV